MSNDETPELEPLNVKPLLREIPAPPALEDRVVNALKSRGLIRTRRGITANWWQIAAAAILLLAAGYALGRNRKPAIQPHGSVFVLLLHVEGNWQKPANSIEATERVNEYRTWAGQLRAKGELIEGTKLRDDRHDLGAGPAGSVAIAGFFEITAPTLDEALAIARTCPHLRYGGQVEVREVQDT